MCVDFLYNSIIGILDYLQILGTRASSILDVNEYHPEFALTISAISFISFIFAFPVCYIQVTNAIKNTTTHERFAYSNQTKTTGVSNSSQASMPSMTLIRSSDEQLEGELGKNIPLINEHKSNICCCYKSKNSPTEMISAD